MTWALSQQTGSPTRKLILLAHANHAHADGTTSWAAVTTIAAYAECSPRTVQREMDVLLRSGCLRPGDQLLLKHVPSGRRPIVYDLAMSDERRQEWATSYRHGEDVRAQKAADGARGGHSSAARRASQIAMRGDTGVTPVENRGDKLSPHLTSDSSEPVIHRGDMDVTPGVTPVSPKPSFEPSLKPPPPPTPSAAVSDSDNRAEAADGSSQSEEPDAETVAVVDQAPWPAGRRPAPTDRVRLVAAVRACGVAGHDMSAVRHELAAAMHGATSPVRVALTRLSNLATIHPIPSQQSPVRADDSASDGLPWCGECDHPGTRWMERPDGRVAPCPRCSRRAVVV